MASDDWKAKHVVLLDTIDCHAALSLEDATVKISHVRGGISSVTLTRAEMDEIAKAWMRYRIGDDGKGGA